MFGWGPTARTAGGGAAAAAACLASLALVACSSSGPGAADTKDPPTSTTVSTGAPDETIVRAYTAAVQALTDAELHSDPDWPALFQTMVDPELGHVRSFIDHENSLKYHSEGGARVIRARVTSYAPARAEVEACVFDQVIAKQSNGEPVPGNAGQPTYGIEKAVMTPTGRSTWALQDGTAQQYPTAEEAGPLCAG
jgi:hypothetical protein